MIYARAMICARAFAGCIGVVSALALSGVQPAGAQARPDPARLEPGKRYLIQLEPGQADAPQAERIVGALRSGLDRHGLVYDLSDRAELIATYDIDVDQGRWVGRGDGRRFIYTATLTIGLSPADHAARRLSREPAFGVRVSASSPEPDWIADVGCMARLGIGTLTARYSRKGRVAVDGSSCARR